MSAFLPPDSRSEYRVTDRAGKMLVTAGAPDARYSAGWIGTPHGVVGAYVEDRVTSLFFIHEGREHRAWWNRRFQERALVTLCKRFAAQIVGPPDDARGGR